MYALHNIVADLNIYMNIFIYSVPKISCSTGIIKKENIIINYYTYSIQAIKKI